MLEAYSKNQTIPATTGILPFNSITLKKGCTAELNGVSSIQLNKCGVYEITLNINGLASTAGAVTVAMTKNGVPQPQATRSLVGQTTTEGFSLPITTLVQVKDNDSCRCCDAPTIIQFLNQDVAWVGDVDVVVTKLC
nr:MAG TPA: hypothetical protein [Caudoviricetes sp.]